MKNLKIFLAIATIAIGFSSCKKDLKKELSSASEQSISEDGSFLKSASDFGGCDCEGRMQSFSFKYNGTSTASIQVKNKKGSKLITTFNVAPGQEYTVQGFDKQGRLEAKTILVIEGVSYEIHTSCSVNIMDDTYGPINITGYVDGQGSSCNATIYDGGTDPEPTPNPEPAPNNDCACEGKMQNFSAVYNGTSGVTVSIRDEKSGNTLAQVSNVQNGDIITATGFDHKGRLGVRTQLIIGAAVYEIHTSCSVNILGESFGPFRVVSYTDGSGSFCGDNTPPVSTETFTECAVKGADPGSAFYQAVWLDDWAGSVANGNVSDRGYRFVGGAGSFKELPDGKAVLSGELYSPNFPNDRFMMTVYFTGKSNWTEWSALGRSFKNGAGYITGAHLDWTYYTVDETKNNLMVGLGDNDGFTTVITARPANLQYGFQIGSGGANDKNSAYGMAGWFFYNHPDGTQKAADWNLDVLSCEEK